MSEINKAPETAAVEKPETPAEGKQVKKDKKKEKRTVGQEILSWILTILVAVVAALVIRSVIFEPVRVDGESMDDTLANGEIMFVSKFDYSSTWLCLPWQDNAKKETAPRFTIGGNPRRFDVVICRYPGRGDTNFVKRVIGLPGDTIRLEDGYLYIKADGEEEEVRYEEPYINDEYRVGYLNSFMPYYVPKKGDTVNGETVEQDMYFVMGDHRNNSNDSRSVGPISRDMIIGHVRQVVFPFSQWRGVQNGLDVKAE